MLRYATVLAFAALLPALPAHARLLDDQHAHDGFFLRFHLGGGRMDARADRPADPHSGQGPSGHFGFALGGAIVENLILYGEYTQEQASLPYARLTQADWQTRRYFNIGGFGPGLAYYFMPVNLYVAGSVLFLSSDHVRDSSGAGLKFSIGKEWWVSRNWGLGIAGYGMFSRVDNGPESKIDASNYGLAFTATYN